MISDLFAAKERHLLVIGEFKFSVATTAFESLSKKVSYRWAENKLSKGNSVLFFSGADNEEISIKATLYPLIGGKNAREAFDRLKAIAAAGKEQIVIDSSGRSLGRWVITALSCHLSAFSAAGDAKKIEIDINLKEFFSDLRD